MEQPLAERNILVTRARKANDELVTELERFGARVIHCPTIEIVPPASYQELDQALAQLDQYQCLLFTSKNSVDALLNRLSVIGYPVKIPADVKVLAVGSATAAALSRAGIMVSIVPADYRAEGALTSLIEYFQDDLSRCRFLFPRAAQGRELLVVELQKLGARVDLIEAYRTQTPAGGASELQHILTTESIDLVTFTSPSTIFNMVEMVAPASMTQVLTDILIACIGPVTANAARDCGLTVNICPAQSNAGELAQAIKNHFLP